MVALTVLDAGRRLVVRCGEELSEGTVPRLERQLLPYLGRAKAVFLDLSDVPFANSEGLRWILRLDGGLREQQKPLRVLVRPGSRVERALALTGYDRMVDLHRSARSAWRA